MFELVFLPILLIMLLIWRIVKWVAIKLIHISGTSAHRAYPEVEEPQNGITYEDLYWKLEVWNDEDDDCDPDDYDLLGDDIYDEILDRVQRRTGSRPSGKDPVPEWVMEEYGEWV